MSADETTVDTDIDPTELTVSEVEEAIEDVDDIQTLELVRDREEAGSDRVTAIQAIDERLEDLGYDGETREDEMQEQLDALSEDLSPEEAYQQTESMKQIRVRSLRGFSTRNFHFPKGEVKSVPATAEVKHALRRGQLQLVSNHA